MYRIMVAISVIALWVASFPTAVFGISISKFYADENGAIKYFEVVNDGANDVDVTDFKISFFNSNYNPSSNIELGSGVFTKNSGVTISTDGLVVKSGGAIEVIIGGDTMSAICWKAVEKCKNNFDAVAVNGSTGILGGHYVRTALENKYELVSDFDGTYLTGGFVASANGENDEDGTGNDNKEKPDAPPQYCSSLRLSEANLNEKWLEIYNSSDKNILAENLKDCLLLVQKGDAFEPADASGKTKESEYALSAISEIKPYEYVLIDGAIFKNWSLPKYNGRMIKIVDAENEFDDMTYSTHKTGTSFAYFSDGWKQTYNATPEAENVYQQYQTCEAGKHINVATGNCVKDPDPPAECAEGQFRNPATGRCKKLASETGLAECAEGQFRNPATNRCKKIASDDDLVPCAEGWERNPETNRCRKAVIGSDAAFAVAPFEPSGNDSLGWIGIGAGGTLAIGGMIAWQFRPEIGRFFGRIRDRVKR